MRKVVGVVLVMVLCFSFPGYSQAFPDPFREPDQNTLAGGLGLTWIDGQPYTTFTIAPDISLGKFGIGIYLQLLLDNQNKFTLRKDEYQDGAGILRAIRYIRYGRKYDPFYARVGMLEMASLANGFLMWNYNNGSNYDKRKIGLELDVDMGTFGFESVVSNLNKLELVGTNIFVRPFQFFMPDALLLKDIRLYGTFVMDRGVAVRQDSTSNVQAFGFGADLHWLDYPFIKSFIYADFGKFQGYGSGKAVGITAIVPELGGFLGLAAKFEKRFINEQFIPNFFGPMYDLSRFPTPNLNVFQRLKNAPKSEGYFGQLAGHIAQKIRIIGNFQRLNGRKYSGILHLEASAPDLIPNINLRAYYDKSNIESFRDVRTLDINSISTVEISYQLNRFMWLTAIYRWYWIEYVEDGIKMYRPIERFEPRITFSYTFQ